jgi:hypothetical protein
MNSKHIKTIKLIFRHPVLSGTPWADIERLLIALGAEVTEGNGSRGRVALNGIRAVFHRPHPQKETDKGAVIPVRRLLTEAGYRDDDI